MDVHINQLYWFFFNIKTVNQRIIISYNIIAGKAIAINERRFYGY